MLSKDEEYRLHRRLVDVSAEIERLETEREEILRVLWADDDVSDPIPQPSE